MSSSFSPYQTYSSGGQQPTVADKATSGLAGQGKKTEGLQVSLEGRCQSAKFFGKIPHVFASLRLAELVSNGASSAKAGSGKRMEAIRSA